MEWRPIAANSSKFNVFRPLRVIGGQAAISLCACRCGARPGWHLTTLFGNTAVMPMAVPKKKRSLLPLLTVVFLASYGLMTMLIVEQGTTIQAQQQSDSCLARRQPGAVGHESKGYRSEVGSGRSAEPRPRFLDPGSFNPSTFIPNPVDPGTISVSSDSVYPDSITPSPVNPDSRQPRPYRSTMPQAGQERPRNPQTQVPPMPASDLTDQRRVLITI